MNLAELTNEFTKMAEKSPDALGGSSLKFSFPEGVVMIDEEGKVSNNDREADCTISTKLDDLQKIISGDLNPMTAVMLGKIKIKGDMGVAMKLQSLMK